MVNEVPKMPHKRNLIMYCLIVPLGCPVTFWEHRRCKVGVERQRVQRGQRLGGFRRPRAQVQRIRRLRRAQPSLGDRHYGCNPDYNQLQLREPGIHVLCTTYSREHENERSEALGAKH